MANEITLAVGANAEPEELSVTAGDQHVAIKNVLVGEVWICSGQSNMEWALNDTEWARHPGDPRLDGVYGTILFDDLGQYDTSGGDGRDLGGHDSGQPRGGPHQRNVTVFADGEVDRSPCGSGTSARLALLAADGRLGAGQVLRHDSIIDTTFLGRVAAEVEVDLGAEHRPAVITEVAGMAYRTGAATFGIDADDPLGTGFVLR